jgi:hypothetical protein
MEDIGEVVDLSMAERYTRQKYVTSDEGEDLFFDEETGWSYEILPEEIMEQLVEYVGDGLNKVTVGAELGVSDYGNKGGAWFSVSVVCDSNPEVIVPVHDILRRYIQQQVELDADEMADMRDKLVGKPPKLPPTRDDAPPAQTSKPVKGRTPHKVAQGRPVKVR